MTEDDDAFADNPAPRVQARALREQARHSGLEFEAFLPPLLADWLLERIESGMFASPAEAVFAIFDEARDLEPRRKLRGEVLRRMIDLARANFKPTQPPHDEMMTDRRGRHAQPRSEPARWQMRSR